MTDVDEPKEAGDIDEEQDAEGEVPDSPKNDPIVEED